MAWHHALEAALKRFTREVFRPMKNHEHGVNRPLCYTLLLQWLTDAANKCGYALGLHGSMSRDLDLIAAPWTEEAVSADQLVAALTDAAGGFIMKDLLHVNPHPRLHGRMAYEIQLGRGLYIDVSVMPRSGDVQVSMYGKSSDDPPQPPSVP